VKALVAASNKSDGDFRHVLQRARDDRADAAALAALTEQLSAAGVAIIDRPDHGQRTTKALSELVTPDDAKLTSDSHHGCPGHAAYLGHTFRGIEATYVCLDWKANGHRDRYNATSRPAGAPIDDQAKAERREVITRNREWKSATVVRREFLTALLARKTPPKATAIYVATELAYGTAALRRAMEHAHDLAATLLGTDESHTRQAIAALSHNGSDARAQVITLGMVLGAIEQSLDTHTWRNPTDTVKRYFEFLAANGYALTEVEQIAAGTHKRPRRRTRSDTPTTSEQAAA
jgi:ParB family chromosome partitioning protein